MPDILTLLQCLNPYVTTTTLQQMKVILPAIMMMTGRVTMLGISRWTGKGGSYRTVQRFFQSVIPWPVVFWVFFRHHLLNKEGVYLLVGDECVSTKAGKRTYGVDRFFSSLYGKPVPGVSFFALSLVSTQDRRSYPMMVEQIIRSEAEKAAAKAKVEQKKSRQTTGKGKPGRPKGSTNTDKTQIELTPELQRIKGMVQRQLAIINGEISLRYLILDGHFGHHNALQMTRQCGLHLISKLRSDAALYFRYEGPQNKYGRRRIYGDKVNYANIPAQYLKKSTQEGDIQTDIYQATLLHREFTSPLNVVIIVKTNGCTRQRTHVVLFSSDLDLPFDDLIDFYSLRFQIEFNFRDAKQYWGLEDFMNTSERAVTNAANLSLFLVNFIHLLLRIFRRDVPDAGCLDLKALFRAHKYVSETLNLLPEIPDPILLAHIFATIDQIGRIHVANPSSDTS